MKKIRFIMTAAFLTTAILFTACSNPGSSDSSDSNKDLWTGQGGGGTGTSTPASTPAGTSQTPAQNPPAPTYIGTKAPSEAKAVGDIVFNDGSAMSYTAYTALSESDKAAKKTSAIALIFYKGTAANDPLGAKTLGVGLVHSVANESTGTVWCTSSAQAANQKITTIQCEKECSGEYPNVVYTFPNRTDVDKDGSDNLEQIAAFLNQLHQTTDSVVNDTGVGENSTKTPAEAASLYPAFYFAKNYKNQTVGSETASRIRAGSQFESGWYLPTIAELYQLCKNGKMADKVFDIDAASAALGGSQFGDNSFFTSSQDETNDDRVWICGSNDENAFCPNQPFKPGATGLTIYTCAIRAFN